MSTVTIDYVKPALLPTQRTVSQPRIPVFSGSPTFQIYVNIADAHRRNQGHGFLPLDFLRDEYISVHHDERGFFL